MASKTSRTHQAAEPAQTASDLYDQAFSGRGASQGSSSQSRQKRPRRIRRNALKHGLTIPVSQLPYFQDQITSWYEAILEGLPPDVHRNDEIKGICYEIAIQSCELRRIAEMKRVLTSQRLGSSHPFSHADVIHLMTIIEGFIIPPRTTRLAFDARAISMLYRLFGVRRCDAGSLSLLGINPSDLTLYQIKRLSSFERYESRASVRLRKAVKRLMVAIGQE